MAAVVEPQIVYKESFTVVGMETCFISALSPDADNFDVIPTLWDRFIDRIGEVECRSDGATYGLVITRPERERSHPDELLYVAGIAVYSAASIPEGMVCHEVPASTFAVFTHRGPISKLTETAHTAVNVWLPSSEYRWNGLEVERYDDRFSFESAQHSEMEIWMGVVQDGR